jgi:hypothetical protein
VFREQAIETSAEKFKLYAPTADETLDVGRLSTIKTDHRGKYILHMKDTRHFICRGSVAMNWRDIEAVTGDT